MAKKPDYPFMRFWPGDYFKDTEHLSYEQHGIYLTVLFKLWMAGGALKDDDRENAQRFRMTLGTWRKHKQWLMQFLEAYGPDDDRRLTQKRLQIELNVAAENSARQAARSKKAADERWERERALRSASSMHQALPGGWPRHAIITNKNITTTCKTAEGLAERLETQRLKRMST